MIKKMTFPVFSQPSKARSRLINQVAATLILICGGVVIMFPFFWMISTSLKKQWDVYQFPPVWIPNPPEWQNYAQALSVYPFELYALNTLRIVVLTCLGFGMVQPQQAAFKLLETPPATIQEAQRLYKQRDQIRAGLLNAYLAPFRYISAQGEVRHISNIYETSLNLPPQQAFAVQRRAAGSTAQEEAARAHVAGRPREVADALEAEHRVEDVEGDHLHAVRRVRGGRGDPVAHGAGLVDALLQDLPALVLPVEHELVGVLGGVELPHLAPDPQLPEHPLHPEGARLVGDDRHDARADHRVLHQLLQELDERHRRRDLALVAALEEPFEIGQWRHRHRLDTAAARLTASR